MEIAQLSNLIKECGIVGAGGAGFPTSAKIDPRAKTIILNCAECEPLLRLHRQLLGHHAYEILSAFYEIGKTVGAEKMLIGMKRAYTNTIEAVQEYIGLYEGMELKLLDEVYPAGDEVVLIYETTGKVVPPGGLPIETGVAVFNVETVYNVYRALNYQEAVTDKLVTLTGEVEHPMTIRIPLGMTVKEALTFAGKITVSNPAYIMGGPMMGNLVTGNDLITKTTNAIIVLPPDHPVILKKQKNTAIDMKRAAAACCQCSMCTDLCPRHLIGHPIAPNEFMLAATCKDVQDPGIFLNTMYCSSCGLCELYSCPQGLSPRTLITEYKNGLRKAGIRPQKTEAGPVNPAREYRKVPRQRLVARLGLTPYVKKAPLIEGRVRAERVKVLLSQHIGAPAKLAVKTGDQVVQGQVIGIPADGLSTTIHASISGTVTEANNRFVMIDAGRKDGHLDE